MLYGVAEYTHRSTGSLGETPDIRQFLGHVQEVLQTSVRLVWTYMAISVHTSGK